MTLLAKQLDSEVSINTCPDALPKLADELTATQGLYTTMRSDRGLREPHLRSK